MTSFSRSLLLEAAPGNEFPDSGCRAEQSRFIIVIVMPVKVISGEGLRFVGDLTR